jgi:hypothetical protein
VDLSKDECKILLQLIATAKVQGIETMKKVISAAEKLKNEIEVYEDAKDI